MPLRQELSFDYLFEVAAITCNGTEHAVTPTRHTLSRERLTIYTVACPIVDWLCMV